MTTGGPKESYEQSNTVDILKRPLSEDLLFFCRIEKVEFHIFYAIPMSSLEERQKHPSEVENAVRNI